MARPWGVAALTGAAILGAWAATPTLARQADQGAPAAAGDPGKTTFETVCSGCHALSMATDQRKTRDDWAATVETMMSRGAPLTADQAAQVVDYLAKAYGPDSK